jgi:hypothetical protein
MRLILVCIIAILLFVQVASSQMVPVGDHNVAKALKPACMATSEIYNQMKTCKAQGMNYQVQFDANRCKHIKCVDAKKQIVCPSAEMLDNTIMACKRKDMDYARYTDTLGCTQVRCKGEKPVCPTAYDLNKRMESCRADGKEFKYYMNDFGCRQIRCVEPAQTATVMCKKTMSGNCVLINCEDGYQFNSCNYRSFR